MMGQQLSEDERRTLAREVAADAHEPTVADIADVLRVPRESFISGWDAAVEYLKANSTDDDEDDSLGIEAVLGKPTRWRDFVETLNVERF